MKPMTIEDLYLNLQKEIKKGNGDYIVFVTDDEEANGYHALWYSGQVAEEMDKQTRNYCEQYNTDISCCKDRKKAFYIG